MNNRKKIIIESLYERLNKLNKKPIDVIDLFNLEDSIDKVFYSSKALFDENGNINADREFVRYEYAQSILFLNEYLLNKNINNLSEEKIFTQITNWLKDLFKDKYTETLQHETICELLFISGNLAHYNFVMKDRYKEKIDLINTIELISNIEEEELTEFKIKMDKFITKKINLNERKIFSEFEELCFQYSKILMKNKKYPILFLKFAKRFIDGYKINLGISKKALCQIFSELFLLFKFINDEEYISFPENFKRNLDRIDQNKLAVIYEINIKLGI